MLFKPFQILYLMQNLILGCFNSISTNKLQIKNGKGQTLMHILCNNKSFKKISNCHRQWNN